MDEKIISPIQVIIVDDHPVVRSGLRKLLERAPDVHIAGEASNGEAALQLAKSLSPDVILLDLEIPGLHGLEVVRRLQETRSTARILILSAHIDPYYIQSLFAQGIHGYLTKDEAPDTILEAVRSVARGETGWVSRKVAAQMVPAISDDPGKKVRLTDREKEILKGVIGGKTNQEIGFELSISERTVERHIYLLFKKIGVGSRVQLAVRAIRDKLV